MSRNWGILAVLAFALGVVAEERALTNEDVVALTQAKLANAIIVAKVEKALNQAFDLSTEGLIALKKKGVADEVVVAMMKRQEADSKPAPPPPPLPTTPTPDVAKDDARPADPAKQSRMQKFRSRVKSAVTREADDEEEQDPAIANDPRPCAHFQTEGSFWSGRTFKVSVDIGAIDKDVAFTRLLKFVSAGGWRMGSSDRASGLIVASQEVGWSNGRTANLNIYVDAKADRTSVALAFSAGSGVAVGSGGLIKEFCGAIDAAQTP